MSEPVTPIEKQRPMPNVLRGVRDDVAYFLPMGVFLAFTQVGTSWPAFYPITYVLKTAIAGVLLIILWGKFTTVRWNYAWLGILVGVIGIVQWVGMEKLLLHFWPSYPRATPEVFNPFDRISSHGLLWTFLVVRFLGPVVVVPFMEELFWRDFLWRSVLAPSDFKLAEVGEWDWKAAALVTGLFASVHVQWITAIVWGAMIAVLLVRTKSLGACIIAHATTNLLLGIYVLYTHDWMFW